MTVFELIDQLESIAYSDNSIDPNVYIQIGNMQLPLMGVGYYPEVKGVMDECIVLGDTENPKLIL